MKIHTIPAKQSNSGSIHDIADTCDRDILFPKNHHFSVVLASCYGGKGYTVHRTGEAAFKQALKMKEYSLTVIDSDGNLYGIGHDGLFEK